MILIENLLINEKYFTYYNDTAVKIKSTFEIYVNPVASELSRFIDSRARGILDSKGNLYVVGWNEKDYYYEQSFRHPLHAHIFIAIYNQDPSIFEASIPDFGHYSNFTKPEWVHKNGIPIEFIKADKAIYLGEFLSIENKVNNDPKLKDVVSSIFRKAKKINPQYDYNMSYSEYTMTTRGFSRNPFTMN